MSTRSQVEAAIKAIEDKGNNTAKEIRNVLTKLLDYTENQEATTGGEELKSFDFVTDGLISHPGTGSQLQYSCRGFHSKFANFTFLLKISDDSKGNIFTFPISKDHANEFMETIDEILPTKAMRFSIPFRINVQMDNIPNGLSYAIPTNISFMKDDNNTAVVKFDMDFTVNNARPERNNIDFSLQNATAYTSVIFHSSQKIVES